MTIAQELEIRKLQAEIEDLKFAKLAVPFIKELHANLGLQMAMTPPMNWTMQQATAFRQAREKFPTQAGIWLERVEKATIAFSAVIGE